MDEDLPRLDLLFSGAGCRQALVVLFAVEDIDKCIALLFAEVCGGVVETESTDFMVRISATNVSNVLISTACGFLKHLVRTCEHV